MMIIRSQYMELLKTYRDVPLVKILAGIRRCGKSTILEMLRDDLQNNGVAADHIISMRYTSEDFDDGMTDKNMYEGIKAQMTSGGRYYLLLDEVQEIDGWEKAVNSLLENTDTRYLCDRLQFKTDVQRNFNLSDRAIYFYPGLYLVFCRIFGVQKTKRSFTERTFE